MTQSLLCTPAYTTLVRDWLPYWTASVRYQLLTFSHLNPSPPAYHQRSRIHADILTYNACHEPPVTDASNPKNNCTKNDRLQCLMFLVIFSPQPDYDLFCETLNLHGILKSKPLFFFFQWNFLLIKCTGWIGLTRSPLAHVGKQKHLC